MLHWNSSHLNYHLSFFFPFLHVNKWFQFTGKLHNIIIMVSNRLFCGVINFHPLCVFISLLSSVKILSVDFFFPSITLTVFQSKVKCISIHFLTDFDFTLSVLRKCSSEKKSRFTRFLIRIIDFLCHFFHTT